MTRKISFAILAALSLTSGPTAGRPQEAGNPDDTIDTVEVTARREAMRKAIHTFVSNVTRFDGENVARWRFPFCPSVTGVSPEHGEFLRARIVEIATSVGAPLARNQKKCSPNLFVILTPQPDQLWATLKGRNPKMFGPLQPQRVARPAHTPRTGCAERDSEQCGWYYSVRFGQLSSQGLAYLH